MADDGMGRRRLIGIDLAWGEGNGSGCAELVREEGGLSLSRLDLLYSTDEIVQWIAPEQGDWVIAVDAPLVVLNETGRRAADAEASRFYGRFEAGAYPANRKVLTKYARGGEHRGEQLLRALQSGGAKLVERAEDAVAGRLAFETYPHIVMVELFGLERTIKYKKGTDADKRRGQRQLCAAIREHLCGPSASPRLRIDDLLEEMLADPEPPLTGVRLKSHEDVLDGLVCAYTAAWVDMGRPIQGLGEVGAGVMITPEVRGIKSGKEPPLRIRPPRERRKPSPKTERAGRTNPAVQPTRKRPGLSVGRTCCCGCGRSTKATFAPGHDARVAGWLTRVMWGEKAIGELPAEVWRLDLSEFYGGKFAALDLGAVPDGVEEPRDLPQETERTERSDSAAQPTRKRNLLWLGVGQTCPCGCGRATKATFAPGHDARVAGWLIRVMRGEKGIGELPAEVWRLDLSEFYGGKFAALDLGAAPGSSGDDGEAI